MKTLDLTTEKRSLGDLAISLSRWGFVVGVAALLAALALALAQGRVGALVEAYFLNYVFFLSISLGALFFVLLQHLTRAGWSVIVRRVAETMAALLPFLALLLIPVLLGMHHLYHWSDAVAVAQDPVLTGKAGFLNPTFFVIRMVIYFGIWSALAWFFYRNSTIQDGNGDINLSLKMERFSAPGMVFFGLSINFAAFDLLMSLDPHWFSTIFGVYFFSASVVGFFAMLPLLTGFLQHHGILRRAITIEHYHDMGKLLFAFVVFWAYIAFSQYMLIWYGNLPEETGWFLKRQSGPWLWVSLILLFGHFIIPFLALLSRKPKRRPRLLLLACLWMLVMHWVDLYWLIMPTFHENSLVFGPYEILSFLGLGALCVAAIAWMAAAHSLVPEKDPRLAESLAFENA